MTGDGAEFRGEAGMGDDSAGEPSDGPRGGAAGGPFSGPSAGGADSSSGLPDVLIRLHDVLADALAAGASQAWQLSDAEARAAVVSSFMAMQQLQSVYLSLVRDLDDRPSAVPGARAGVVAKSFLVVKLRRTFGQAAQDARAARVLAPDADPALGGLPMVGAALAAGQISREHADIAVRAIRHVPAHLLASQAVDAGDDGVPAQCGGEVLDAAITALARKHDTNGLKNLARHLLDVVDPDGANSFDPNAAERRRLSLSQDSTGMTVVRGELAQPDGALLASMIDHLSKPRPVRTETAEDGTLIEIRDERTAGQRRADALGEMARLAAAQLNGCSQGKGSTQGGEPPRIVIHTFASDLGHARATDPSTGHHPSTGRFGIPEFATGQLADPGLLSRFSCDSVLQKALLSPGGALLDLGRDVRTVTPLQRRALVARDKGCVIPACTAPAHWCEAHHVVYWRDLGPTNITNLALVCSRHHTDIHRGIWALEMKDGVPWARPPDWIDPKQRLIRNTYTSDVRTIRGLGIQLLLNFDEKSDPEATFTHANDKEHEEIHRKQSDSDDIGPVPDAGADAGAGAGAEVPPADSG